MKEDLLKKIKSVLVGIAYGDSLGMPSEFLTREQISNIYPDGLNQLSPSNKFDFIGRQFVAGRVTDDTINSMLLLENIINNNGKITTSEYVNSLIDWKNSVVDSSLVIGPSSLKALEAIERGENPHTTGKFSMTNGSMMKIAPVGIICDYHDLKRLIDTVYNVCYPTHGTNVAITGSAIVAAMVSYSIYGNGIIEDYWDLAYKVIDKTKNYGTIIPCPSLKKRLEYSQEYLSSHSKDEVLDNLYDFIGCGVNVIETVPTVLSIITLAKLDPYVAAKIAANLGGDTDTNASICSAICAGVNLMLEENDIELLENVNGYDFNNIAQKIFDIITSK